MRWHIHIPLSKYGSASPTRYVRYEMLGEHNLLRRRFQMDCEVPNAFSILGAAFFACPSLPASTHYLSSLP